MLTLLVLEGPAGCGKSYTQRSLDVRGAAQILVPTFTFPRPRDYGSNDVQLSLLKDMQILIDMVDLGSKGVNPVRPNPMPRSVTRFMFSQLVYGYLRRKPLDMPQSEEVYRIIQNFSKAWPSLNRFVHDRMFVPPHESRSATLHIHTHFIEPTLDYLEYLRQKGVANDHRSYAFEPDYEIAAYNRLVQAIRMISSEYLRWITTESGVIYSFSGNLVDSLEDSTQMTQKLADVLQSIQYPVEEGPLWIANYPQLNRT